MDVSKPLEMKADAAAVGLPGDTTAATADATAAAPGPPLFEEFYDDWAAFDAAVARATELHHPIRKRSSLTFEVYNRTVSKGRHDRKAIADFLSKTFKCTHGIKFRSRGNGKRVRHKLRDLGCPFHVYASAVEFGATYRVKVRVNDKHNHPIGPDAMKTITGALHDADYDLATHEADARTSASTGSVTGDAAAVVSMPPATTASQLHAVEHVVSTSSDHEANYAQQMQAHAQAVAQAEAQAHAQAQAQAQAEAQAREEAETRANLYVQAQALMKAQAQVQTQALLQRQQHENANEQTHAQSVGADMLTASGHDSEALLEGSMETSMEDSVFMSGAPATTSDVTTVASASSPAVSGGSTLQTSKFEETLTFEALRKRVASFCEERDWDQFHTPRNLLLALTGEVGELCEIFQWKGECKTVTDWSPREKEHLGEELSDVLIYLVRLADKCDVDLPAALNDKIIKNGNKYPADLVRGSSKKYNEYKRMRLDKDSSV